jgi:hypothetical protein
MKTFKQFLESKDPLKDTEIEMFFRQELGLGRESAASAREWVLGDADWGDLEGDTWDHILDYIGDVTDRDIYSMKSHVIEEFALEKISMQMLNKYGIEL